MCNYFCIYLMLFSTNKRTMGLFQRPPIVFVYVFRCRTYSAPIPANRHITALTDRPIRCRTFSPRSLKNVR